MRRRLTPEQRETAKQSYDEIGHSLAKLVLEHDTPEEDAWALVADLGLYERWELQGWLVLHRKLHRNEVRKADRRKARAQKLMQRAEQARPTKLLKALRKTEIG